MAHAHAIDNLRSTTTTIAAMDHATRQTAEHLKHLRRQNAAWQLLAARRAPLIVACLKTLFDARDASIPVDDMEQTLAEMLAEHANEEEYEVGSDFVLEARRELRDWIRRGLVVEREGRLKPTDELQQALGFVDGMAERIMTSTASRLATVQREIDNLATRLNPDAGAREARIREQISTLEKALADVQLGRFEVLSGNAAIEAIKEVYDLSISLRADFRRVEDSFREADRVLKQSIISEGRHRGEIVDKLLDTHDELLETAEGQTFAGFHQQLSRAVELDRMKQHLKEITGNQAAQRALNRNQQTDLVWLTMRLVSESAGVIKARAASERDVKSFIKTGLAAEHHRVGQLLNELFDVALKLDWDRTAVRRATPPLPCIALDVGNLPLIERLRFKAIDVETEDPLELIPLHAGLEDFDEDFWDSLDTLDRRALFDETRQLLNDRGVAMSIGDLANALPPETHDLETITFWLSLARQAEVVVHEQAEQFELRRGAEERVRFRVPHVELTSDALASATWEI